jgi:hypothetical protein
MNWCDIALIVVVFKILPAGVDGCAEVDSLIVVVVLRGYNFITSYSSNLSSLGVA